MSISCTEQPLEADPNVYSVCNVYRISHINHTALKRTCVYLLSGLIIALHFKCQTQLRLVNTEECTMKLAKNSTFCPQAAAVFVLMKLLLHTKLSGLQLTAIKHDKVVNVPASVCVRLSCEPTALTVIYHCKA